MSVGSTLADRLILGELTSLILGQLGAGRTGRCRAVPLAPFGLRGSASVKGKVFGALFMMGLNGAQQGHERTVSYQERGVVMELGSEHSVAEFARLNSLY